MLNSTDRLTLPVGLQALIAASSALFYRGASAVQIYRAEAGLVMLVPVAVVFILSQRAIAAGALTGGVKE